jgi:alpha-L-fucosidase
LNSKHHKWNAVKMGPKRDIVGAWQKAAKAQGLRFGVSERFGASFTWWQASHGSDKTGPMAGVPYAGTDPKWADLYSSEGGAGRYGLVHDRSTVAQGMAGADYGSD